jgi:mRNA-degrading endonuclease toxin of MazEF toxin-antitoxin module
MGEISQFDIYWVNLDPTQGSEIAKTRPKERSCKLC